MALNTRTAPDGTPYTKILGDAFLPLYTLARAAVALAHDAVENNINIVPMRIVGRDPSPAPGRFLLECAIRDNGDTVRWTRILDGEEILGYARGRLAAAGLHDLIPDSVELPVMLDVDEAAGSFTTAHNKRTGASHLTRDGIISRISNGRLEVVYLKRRERALFKQEIDALKHDAVEGAMTRWQQTRDKFGLTLRVEITAAHYPSPGDNLAIDPTKPFIVNAANLVQTADHEGWFRSHAPLDPDAGNDAVFHIPNIGGAPADVPAEHVMPWLLGVADHYGPDAAKLIAYRPGLV